MQFSSLGCKLNGIVNTDCTKALWNILWNLAKHFPYGASFPRGHVAVHRHLPARQGRVVGKAPAACLAAWALLFLVPVFAYGPKSRQSNSPRSSSATTYPSSCSCSWASTSWPAAYTGRHHRRHDEEQRHHAAHRQLSFASWVGTTGAAMLLIRPLLRANLWRRHRAHVVVFFIFLVANAGGCSRR